MKAKLFLFLTFSIAAISHAAGAKPFAFPRSTPEAQGVPPGAILDLVEALDQIDTMNSFMLVRHGHVVAEGWWSPYDAPSRKTRFAPSARARATIAMRSRS